MKLFLAFVACAVIGCGGSSHNSGALMCNQPQTAPAERFAISFNGTCATTGDECLPIGDSATDAGSAGGGGSACACSIHCAQDSECGASGVCVGGTCAKHCAATSDCPAGEACEETATSAHACIPLICNN